MVGSVQVHNRRESAALDMKAYSHLSAEERIRNIRFYQQIGFPVREISGIIDASIPVKRKALKNRIKALKREQDELKRLIEKALKLLDSLS